MIYRFDRSLSAALAVFTLTAGCVNGTAGGVTQKPPSVTVRPNTVSPKASFSAAERVRLSRELADVLGTNAARFSLSVRDLTAGESYTYHPRIRVATASIIKVEFLIGLLLKAKMEGRGLTAAERDLAVPMIHVSSNEAATAIFTEIGGYSGLNATSRKLGLKDTRPGMGGWGTTTTSAQDQIKVLSALTSSSSPITAASRRYVLDLMDNVASDENWGVSAAAAPGETFA